MFMSCGNCKGFYDCTKSHARCENVTDIVIWDCLTFRVKTVIFCFIDITYVRGINYENKIVYLLIIWAYSSQCATNLCVLVLTCITTKRIKDLEWQLTKFSETTIQYPCIMYAIIIAFGSEHIPHLMSLSSWWWLELWMLSSNQEN